MSDRRILELTGSDAVDFLQGLITKDMAGLDHGMIYAALLTPQGKYISDFFVARSGEGILLDVAEAQADTLIQRLSMYKLRADVMITTAGLHLHRGTGALPSDGYADPRHPALGWRAWRDTPQVDDPIDWVALRVEYIVPESGVELTTDSFILEMDFERLDGVDFRKGCYVGQEVTARMKHKTELRKGLTRVCIDGDASPGTEITANGKAAGTLLSRSGNRALAYLRFDRAVGDMQAGAAKVTRDLV